MNIAKYTASIGFKVDTQDIKKVDRALSKVEKQIQDFRKKLNKTLGFEIGKFKVDQKKLNFVLGEALDSASNRLVFQVSRFDINQSRLNGAMLNAYANAARAVSAVKINPLMATAGSGNRSVADPVGRVRSGSTRSGVRTSAGLGGIGLGLMGPLGYGALALAGGGYGLGALNRRNQEVVSAQLQAQAVVQQAGGTAEQGTASFEWLRREGNRIGFNYLEASPDYNNLLAGLTGAGMSVQQGQSVFKGFSELARVNKLDKVRQQRLFRALAQVAGKDQLMSEELRGQISEALPGGVSLFAEAYQRQIGGTLTGSAATKALEQAMKKGQVKGNILTIAGQLASERAAPNIEAAGRASQAEQQRYQNTITDLAVVASNSGVEEGFARIFRTLSAGLSESGDLVQGLAEGFNNATKWADDLLLFPQSFVRALEGKDSLVADWLGVDTTKQLVQDFKDIKEIWSQISSIKAEDIFGNFLPSLQSTSKELAAIINFISQGKDILSGNMPTQTIDYNSVEQIDPFGTGAYSSPIGLAKAGINNFLVGLSEYGDRKERMSAINDPNSVYYNDPAGYDAMQKDRAMASQEDSVRNSMINNQIQIQLNVDAVTLSQMNIEAQADLLTQRLAIGLEQVLVQFPNKE